MSFRLPSRFDEQGKKLCTVPRCSVLVPKGRRHWCGDEHMRLGYFTLSRFAGAVGWRDGKICALCGLDCGHLRAWLDYYRRCSADLYKNAWTTLEEMGFDSNVYELWEADHIIPRCEGGPNTLDNGRTLCHPCHKRVTREMHARHKEDRRGQNAMQFGAAK